ncbi:Abscisic acid G-protein coupled receptor-domain-containing protein [Gautieria morchelliformis]|nr:Abscisic acid G-protein coupled receptor-domain-containing protein [Gautieria morchelliformis]
MGMASVPQTLFETSLICVGRVSLFFACRHYLLRSLYHDLRHLSLSVPSKATLSTLSQQSSPRTSGTELDELPRPATTPRTPSSATTPSSQRHGSGITWHSTWSRGTFALCFSESCTLFMLVVSQAMDVFSHRARFLNWRISLGLLLFTILLAAPLQQCLLLTYKAPSEALNRPRRSFRSHLVFTGVPYLIYLVVLSYIPLPARLNSPELTSATLSRLVVLGTIILGILAGFGAASAVLTYFHLSLANRERVSEAQIVSSEQALFRVRSDLLERQRQLERSTASEPEPQNGFLSRLNPFSGNAELSSIRREIQGLEALEYQMRRNVEYMQQRRTAALYAGTIRGRVGSCVGGLFALYCAFRVMNPLLLVQSIANILHPLSAQTPVSTSTPDLLAGVLARVVSLFWPVSEVDIAAASRQLSLLLVGAIILSSVRSALRGVTRILQVTGKNLAASLLLLILAQLMGTYLLSTLIQLRTSFPSSSSTAGDDSNLFATLPEYHVFGPLWDGAFLASVAVSGAVKWFDQRVNGP